MRTVNVIGGTCGREEEAWDGDVGSDSQVFGLVWPGETVKIAVDFSHGFEGEQFYLFHCHILEHEDSGMRVNVKVVEP